jgi:hypothetical protein
MSQWIEPFGRYTNQWGGKCMRKGCTNNRTGADNLCDEHASRTGVAVLAPPRPSPTHPCPIPGCKNTVVYEKLICWAHWAKVPTKLRVAVYASWNRGNPNNAHGLACQAAIEAVLRKEVVEE